MGVGSNYAGDICFVRTSMMPWDGEEREKLFHALRDATDNPRILDYSDSDHAHYSGALGFSMTTDYENLSPWSTIDILRDYAKIIGKWGYYFEGTLVCYLDNGEMYRVAIDQDQVCYSRYMHESHDWMKKTNDCKLVKLGEHDLHGLVDPHGTLPGDDDEGEQESEGEQE